VSWCRLRSGRLRETWVNVKIAWLRLVAIGRYLGAEDRVEAEVKRPGRRRLVPFAAMMVSGPSASCCGRGS
jgi:hypothetical protein